MKFLKNVRKKRKDTTALYRNLNAFSIYVDILSLNNTLSMLMILCCV